MRIIKKPVLAFFGLIFLGICVRLVFLFLSGDLQPQADEWNYIYLALSWNRFSFYNDTTRFLWPPGYPFLLSCFLEWFGPRGIFYSKFLQVLLSGIIGANVILIAKTIFSRKASWFAGLIWCFYLPLIAYTHYNWAEPIYLVFLLPSIYLLIRWLKNPDNGINNQLLLLISGLLYGVSLLFKEVGALLGLVLFVFIAWRSTLFSHWWFGLRNGLLFLVTIFVVILPWTLRNVEMYGRFVPIGVSIGENSYWGLNGLYQNFDLAPISTSWGKINRDDFLFRWFVGWEPGSKWDRAEKTLNVVDRNKENFKRGLEYSLNHKGYFLKTRLKKLADWVTPLSFFTRHIRRDVYHGFLSRGPIKRTLLIISLSSTIFLLVFSIGGYHLVLGEIWPKLLIGIVIGFFILTALLVSMSRFRIPVEPILVVLSGGFLEKFSLNIFKRIRPLFYFLGNCMVLFFLWIINLPEIFNEILKAWK